ncbi:enoyl-CoA hydratase/isomerase family protein [Piscibacillus halophilus]|mgnify:CR=1 FL=1|uniref:Enoyl-CoA hydratase/3-hydroxypropionyl-coenzyme A dehydratase n=1 Tax=Piscibacillus halophilus TaxID=571933 RepID=A0A1H9KEF8_9BACI|nr:enoyl-CoA hydratase-related protein [Piscibacillus halophilus]SEQ97459.1 enoyl-CoA hydratase/3-hydroxypropionyl-coenzyme A dehydratase [Piscibacillus halophilus]
MSIYQNIEVENNQGLFWLTLNRPDVRNALDATMLQEIDQAVTEAEEDENVKVIIFRGAGGKSFAAGADIKQLKEREPLEALVPGMQGLYKKIEDCSKATIAVVEGYALGGGCELALACDIRVATDNAKLGLPELNLGIIPGAGGTQRLSRIVGKGHALDMILTGKIVKGDDAYRMGLVQYYVTQEELDEQIDSITEKIVQKGPVAIKLAKHAVHHGYDLSGEAAMWIEKLSQAVVFGTEDKQEGTSAFLEKRKPDFKNR